MKKLNLNLNDLRVDSFEIKGDSKLKGTVQGNISGAPCTDTRNGAATCDCPSYIDSCVGTCYSCVTCSLGCPTLNC